MKRILTVGCLLALFFPYLALVAYVGEWSFALDPRVARVFGFTFLQAALSTATAMVLGVLAGLGLLHVRALGRPTWERATEALVLLPNVVPVLFTILAAYRVLPELRGLWGIVFLHTLLNLGLVAVAFSRLIATKMGGMAELAWIEGASGRLFFWRGVVPYRKGDLFVLGLSVFALCFSSFAIPLIVGGSRATTVEVLIYERVRLAADWSQALGLAFLQTLIIFLLTWTARRTEAGLAPRSRTLPFLRWPGGLVVALFPGLLVIVGLLPGIAAGLEQLRAQPVLTGQLPELLGGSFVVGIGTGLLSLLLLLLIAWVAPDGWLRKVLLGYVAPSSVLTGFALLLVWRAPGEASLVKVMLGLALISVPSFYRLQWDGLLQSLRGQITVAETLGASGWLIFSRVIVPQVWRSACFLAGLAAFWAWGDFALSAVVAERSLTVAMVAQNLMESYRLDLATVLVWILIAGGTLTFALFWGVGHVGGEKSQA